MLLVHELHEARDRVLLLCQSLEKARERELPAYRTFLDTELTALRRALDDAHIPEHYRVAIVGRFKVGKSSFVNKLAEESLAGVKTNPETAAISVFRYADEARAEVELVSRETWENLCAAHAENPDDNEAKRYAGFVDFNQGREPGRETFDLKRLESEWVKPGGHVHRIAVGAWTSPQERSAFKRAVAGFTSSQRPMHYLVNKLTIYAPIPLLRDHIELIDTPGLDDTERFRVLLTEELVRDVDAILFLTLSGAAYPQSDKDFLIRQLRRRQLKHLQIIVTKADETFKNAQRDAEAESEAAPTYEKFRSEQIARVRREIAGTLNELLGSNQLSDEEGYYFMEQLESVPIHLISATFHSDGDRERGGIDGVRDGLYKILSTSHRFEQSRQILTDRLESSLVRLRDQFSERLTAIESDYDPNKVKAEIESIRTALDQHLSFFAGEAGSLVELLGQRQTASFQTLPLVLDNVSLQARDVLGENERADVGRHWRSRRAGYWGYLHDLQVRIADRIFPVVESRLNELRGHLDEFMRSLGARLEGLQASVRKLEEEHRLSGLEPMALAEAQRPVFDELEKRFTQHRQDARDSIVNRLEDFVTEEVTARLDEARVGVAGVAGTGTVARQGREVQDFYGRVKLLLSQALREHLEKRTREFAAAIVENAKSVAPRIREATLAMIDQRIEAIKSRLAIASEDEKRHVIEYLQEMYGLARNFAAEPATITEPERPALPIPLADDADGVVTPTLVPVRYEIADGASGYTYERIFRPYLDDAQTIEVDDAYIRKLYQVDNFVRFCALAIRLAAVKTIRLRTGTAFGEDLDEADSRLETLRRQLAARNVVMSFSRHEKLHDREIRLSNGWIITIGRGLDIYYPPESWVSIEAADFSLRRCKQTKVDISHAVTHPAKARC
jgi:predicted GTPase